MKRPDPISIHPFSQPATVCAINAHPDRLSVRASTSAAAPAHSLHAHTGSYPDCVAGPPDRSLIPRRAWREKTTRRRSRSDPIMTRTVVVVGGCLAQTLSTNILYLFEGCYRFYRKIVPP